MQSGWLRTGRWEVELFDDYRDGAVSFTLSSTVDPSATRELVPRLEETGLRIQPLESGLRGVVEGASLMGSCGEADPIVGLFDVIGGSQPRRDEAIKERPVDLATPPSQIADAGLVTAASVEADRLTWVDSGGTWVLFPQLGTAVPWLVTREQLRSAGAPDPSPVGSQGTRWIADATGAATSSFVACWSRSIPARHRGRIPSLAEVMSSGT